MVKTDNTINMFLYAFPAEKENNGDTVDSSSYQKRHITTQVIFFFSSASFEQERLLQRR